MPGAGLAGNAATNITRTSETSSRTCAAPRAVAGWLSTSEGQMSLNGRVEKLEQQIGADLDDGMCHCAVDNVDLRVRDEGEEKDTSPPQACSVCGGLKRIIEINV